MPAYSFLHLSNGADSREVLLLRTVGRVQAEYIHAGVGEAAYDFK